MQYIFRLFWLTPDAYFIFAFLVGFSSLDGCVDYDHSCKYINIRSSCEIADFVETHLYMPCVILRSRVLRVVCPHY